MYLFKLIKTCENYYVKLFESTREDIYTGYENYVLSKYNFTPYIVRQMEYKRLTMEVQKIGEYLAALEAGTIKSDDELLYVNELSLYRMLKARLDELEHQLYPNGKKTRRKTGTSRTGNHVLYLGAGYQRARTKLVELVMRNLSKDLRFVTLTYKTEPKTFRDALHDIRLYARRMRKFDKDFKYIAVPELGKKSGRFHWHLIQVCKAQITETELNDIYWKCGFLTLSDFKKKNKGLQQNAFRVVNYMSKDFKEPVKNNILMNGRNRAYYISKGWMDDIYKCYLTKEQAEKVRGFLKKCATNGTMDSYREHKIYIPRHTRKHIPYVFRIKSFKGQNLLNRINKSLDVDEFDFPESVFDSWKLDGRVLYTRCPKEVKAVTPDFCSYSGVLSNSDSAALSAFTDSLSTDYVSTNILSDGEECETRKTKLFILENIVENARNRTKPLQTLELISYAVWQNLDRHLIDSVLEHIYLTGDTDNVAANFSIMEDFETDTANLPDVIREMHDSLRLRL